MTVNRRLMKIPFIILRSYRSVSYRIVSYITSQSCRNDTCIKHTASVDFVSFWLVLPFTEWKNFLRYNGIVFTNFQLTKLNPFNFKISASGLFLKYS